MSIRDYKYISKSQKESEMEQKPNPLDTQPYYGGEASFCAMIEAFGAYQVYSFCKCNAFKYLWQAGKGTELSVKDLEKAAWYLEKAKELAVCFPKPPREDEYCRNESMCKDIP